MKTKKVTQTPTGIEINDIKPIVGYGGIGSVGYYVSFDTSWFYPEDPYAVVDVEASGGDALEVDSD